MVEKITCSNNTLGREVSSEGKIPAPIRKSRVTIEDVAAAAGVSTTTVSRVVSGASSRIGKATVQKVEETVKRLHYSPNRLIRSLQQGKSDTIAYASFYPGLHHHDEVQQQTLLEIYCAAHHAGYDVLLPTTWTEDSGIPLVTHLLDGRCDGVILEAPRNTTVLKVLAEQNFPTVVTGNRQVPPGIGTVYGDYADGTRKAMEYLLSLGHRRIAHLAGPVQLWDEAQCRLETYLEVLAGAGISCDKRLILPNWGTETWSVNEKEVEQALDFWLTQEKQPTAVFCASDRLAIALLEAAAKRGLKLPDDLSVIGFDDMPSAQHCNPALTTVRVSVGAIAAAAVKMLQQLIAPPAGALNNETLQQSIPAELVIRQSTAAPATR